MAEFALPRSDEPFDFRRQAAFYSRFRRDYSVALYDAIAERTGPPAGRLAVDVGCGTGFVTTALEHRGWRAVGVDLSAPMLAQAREASRGALRLVRAPGESLPIRAATATLVTCGTSFHWLAPAGALAEFARVLAPGGWVAVFWRYSVASEPSTRLVARMLREVGAPVPEDYEQIRVHPPEPFSGSAFEALPPLVLESTLEFTAEEFHGYVRTLEWVRRLSGTDHGVLLDRLREELAKHHPQGFVERNEEYLYLGQKSSNGHGRRPASSP